MDYKSVLHSGYSNDMLRCWQSGNTGISPNNLMYPLFILENDDGCEDIPSMPGIYRMGINVLKKHLEDLVKIGLKSVLLFGIMKEELKDDNGSTADDSKSNPVIKALPKLKGWFPRLTIACDVCLCGYTSHGHCGILRKDGTIDNARSILRIAQVAAAYAVAGAHIVAPSDMMDGRTAAIKRALSEADLVDKICVLSYAAKFASKFYGPFRDAVNSAPGFGDRKCYQLPIGSKGLALLSAKRDVEEGCDMLMVKPGLAYLDIVKQTKDTFPEYPLFVYQVSGEYSMLKAAAKQGVFSEMDAVEETLTSFRRAGADCIITYFTPSILAWIGKK